MHYPQQTDRASDPNFQFPFKFTGGFGINVSVLSICPDLKRTNLNCGPC